jgi:hypothetical protein
MKTLTVCNQSSDLLGLQRTKNTTKAETRNTLSDHT